MRTVTFLTPLLMLLFIFDMQLYADSAHTITNLSSASIHFFAMVRQTNQRFPYKQGRWFTILPGETFVCEKHNIANVDEQDPRKVSLKFNDVTVDHDWAEDVLSFLQTAYNVYIYCYYKKTDDPHLHTLQLIASFIPPELLDVGELHEATQQSIKLVNHRTLAEYKQRHPTY